MPAYARGCPALDMDSSPAALLIAALRRKPSHTTDAILLSEFDQEELLTRARETTA
jgi:hypothetical protein